MVYGKTIELFLVNGTADSIITAELSNWNGKAIKIPRVEVQGCERKDIRGAGVYFLFCEELSGTPSVYIGESENMLERLRQHMQDYKSGKETFYWNTAIAFTGHDLNKALIRYLEDKLVNTARECGRYKVLTKNTYGSTVMKESQYAIMEEFIANVKIIISTMSYDIFIPVPTEADSTKYFYCKGAGADARGFVSSRGFTVMKGSVISDHVVPSMPTGHAKSYYQLRVKLEKEGVISDKIFQCNYEFSSPSAASCVIRGNASGGTTAWKTEDGKLLRDAQP